MKKIIHEDENWITYEDEMEYEGKKNTIKIYECKICPNTNLPMYLSKQKIRFSGNKLEEIIETKKEISMGLGFFVENFKVKAHWSYTSFHNFRKMIALSIGIDLDEMQGFRKKHPINPEFYKLGWISWDEVNHPIKAFLNHSDDNGEWSSEECRVIYPFLECIIKNWQVGFLVSEFDFENGLNLVSAMKHCSENNLPLNLC
jgi:hypothetical protein